MNRNHLWPLQAQIFLGHHTHLNRGQLQGLETAVLVHPWPFLTYSTR